MFQDTCCITCVIGTIINVITVLVMRTLYIPGKLLREYSRGLVTVFSDNGQGSRKKHEARKPGQKRGVKQLILFNKVNLPLERVCFLLRFFIFSVFILSISIYCLFCPFWHPSFFLTVSLNAKQIKFSAVYTGHLPSKSRDTGSLFLINTALKTSKFSSLLSD